MASATPSTRVSRTDGGDRHERSASGNQEPHRAIPHPQGERRGGKRHRPQPPQGRDARAGRGDGRGQDHDRAGHHAAAAGAARGRAERRNFLRGAGSAQALPQRGAQGARRKDLDDLSGPDDRPQPDHDRRRADRRDDPPAREDGRRQGARQGVRDARDGRHPERAVRRISPPVFGRDEAAGRHRHRAGLQPVAAHRRPSPPPPSTSPCRRRSWI